MADNNEIYEDHEKQVKELTEKLSRYRTALVKGRKHHEHCYGDPECGCFCGLEKELEGEE
jgi:hypothetical protein